MVLGALSGMGAAVFCHPLDVIRVRLQTGGDGGVLRTTLAAYHQGGLYAGIGAAFLRQWTYGSCRMGIYSYLLEGAKESHGGTADAVPFATKLGMGMLAGGIGSFVGTPSELALVRLCNDGKLPLSQRRNYTGVVDCLRRIALEEGGIRAWWTGATPTVCRATVLSACLMGGTSQAKILLKSTGRFEKQERDSSSDSKGDWLNGIPLLFGATLISSFCANVVANPFDVVKSRMQNMPVPAVGQEPLYKGSLDCLRKSVASEGISVLSKGFGPAFVKLAPYSVISLTLVDTMTKAFTGKEAL
jgi:solute carrier family 25 oxoglutarate transporter 11